MLKYILGFLMIGSLAMAAGKLQDSDFASSSDITGAGGTVSQLLNTSKIYDNVNAQVLNTTLSAKITNPMTTAEDLIKGGVSGAPTRLAVGSNGQCLVVSGGAVAWGACGTSSPLTTKGDLYTYDTSNARLPVGTNGQVLTANSATATGLEWQTPASGGDFSSNTATSVDGEVVVFDGTGGKTGKRATGTGVAKLSSGVLSAGNVDLTSEVTGDLPYANFTQSAGLSVLGRSANSTGDVADITAGADFNILRRSGTSIGFGSVDLSQSGAVGSSILGLSNGGSNKALTAANGGIVYSDADSFEILTAGSSGQFLQSNGAAAPSWATAPNGDAIQKAISQTGHGLAVGDVIRYNGTAYVEAQANSDANAEVIGIVSAVADANNFTFVSNGFVSGLSGLTAGETYFLSAATAGAITTTEPSGVGQVSKPVFLAVSTTSGYFIQSRGYVVGGNSGAGTWLDSGLTASDFTGFGSVTSINIRYKVDGKTLCLQGRFTTGTNTATEGRMNLPGGYTTSSSIPTLIKVGDLTSTLAQGGNELHLLAEPSKTYFTFGYTGAAVGGLNKANPNAFLDASSVMAVTGCVELQ